jgi:hypothetical protein
MQLALIVGSLVVGVVVLTGVVGYLIDRHSEPEKPSGEPLNF